MEVMFVDEFQDSPRLRARVHAERVEQWPRSIGSDDAGALERIRALVRDDEALSAQRAVLDQHAAEVFDLRGLADPQMCEQLALTAQVLQHEVATRAERVTRAIGGSLFDRDRDLDIHLLPGTRLCFGLAGGGQVFGVVPGASSAETGCFLEHTFYHELSDQWASPRTTSAQDDPVSAASTITWILSLIRNEGIANLYCLDELARMDHGAGWRYFTYAPLIGDDAATRASIVSLLEAFEHIRSVGLDDATAFVNGTLKNPDLPLINLIGIQMATTLVDRMGESEFHILCRQEPEEFLAAWLDSGDSVLGSVGPEHRLGLARWAELDAS